MGADRATLSGETVAPLFEGLAGRLVVAYSGGVDSHVLLHLVATCQRARGEEGRVHALHINHGLSENATAWEEHCREATRALGLPFTSVRMSVAPGAGLEERARRARYAAYRGFIEPGDRLLLAHHQEDQAETILFRLLRGGAAAGLGMPASRVLGSGVLMRPLLGRTKESIRQYAQAERLEWVVDESNSDLGFDRNYLRHRVIPMLAERWPGYGARLARGASLAAESLQLTRELGDLDADPLVDGQRRALEWKPLLLLSPARRRNVVRRWIERASLPQPGSAQLDQLLRQLATSREDAGIRVAWRGAEVRRYRRHLHLLAPLPPREPLAGLRLEEGVTLAAGGGVLEVRRARGRGVRLPADSAQVALRYRSGGERCRPRGRSGSHPLKKVLQEMGVPPWLRNRIPLVYCGGRLVAVAGLFDCHEYAVADDETGWHFRWRMGDGSRLDADE